MNDKPSVEPDRLTGLLLTEAAISRILSWQTGAGVRGEQAPVHTMLLRLRNLSAVNFGYGLAMGDGALSGVAACLVEFAQQELGADSLVARVAGDAFLVAANAAMSRERWQFLAEELLRSLARPIMAAGGDLQTHQINLRPRIAISRIVPGEQPQRILTRLTEALDRYPSPPPSCPVWVDGSISPPGRGATQLEVDLLAALDCKEIEIVYQPQFAAGDGSIVGAEALARWQHPQLGPIGPVTLFAIAERADHVRQLSDHIIRAALASARAWPRPHRLSLNVTAADIAHRCFAETITSAIEETGFPAGMLTLEITEEALVYDLEQTARSLRQLTERGVRIALDDFGARFCNFRYLKMLPLHYLKLDRSMIDGIVENPRDLAVLRGIIAMASAIGLEVVAEGIESEAQRFAIAREGCAVWQGFHGAPPMSAEKFAAL